ncbi:phospholipid-transporting ATPase IF-like isoform X4 [Maniola hyperantus]|uniref:phospholipid-transporting ATPase IF-like isoform X4 n=1 Tax=Aphantopus hyperantus TaxID=2795564 RepID=UPI001568144D|nr:probable phospholipid-transporting ATPase IF isoform X1 [Maniola hyperantus]
MRECGVSVYNFYGRLRDCLRSCFFLLCWWHSNKVSAASQTRQIEVGAAEEAGARRRKHNKIKTSKYTLLMFIPKNLAEQFRRVVNFYFLIVTIIAIVIDSPVSPFTSIAPLSFMVLVTAVKQGYEDWLRHKADNRVNNQIVEIVHKSVIKEVKNSSIAPGTLVRVKCGGEVPADLVLLCAAGEKGKCFITTANLDGETNLKTLRVPPPLVGYTADIIPHGIRIEVPDPVADLYTFYGRLEIPGMDSLALSIDNIMLRGSRVKNTEWAIGCAVYTGEETKLALNSKYSGNKFSSSEAVVNNYLMFFIYLLILEMTGSYTAKMILEHWYPEHELYLGNRPEDTFEIKNILQDLFSFLLLYYYIIPMSLYVTIELYKFIGAFFIGWDEDLRCEETGRPAMANTSDLNEELGQVEVLFSDKTGTLTMNLMVFKACSIRGQIYEERDSKLYDLERFDEPVDIFQTDIRFFFTILALCHSVQVSSDDMKMLSARFSTKDGLLTNLFRRRKQPRGNGNNVVETNGNTVAENVTWSSIMNEIGSKMDYQGSSPDEKALVEAADRNGVTFLGEEGNNLILKIGGSTEMYERLQVIEFTSERKRMSVIVKDKDGKIWLLCKGAETSVFSICKDTVYIEETDRDINTFANKGLRTLAIAYREIPVEEYERVAELIKRIDGSSAEAFKQVTQQYRVLEKELTMLGATAVEDCLQDGVADTLASLRRAGIHTWVLTGDKVETAINVSQSCSHISENDRRLYLVGIQNEEALQSHLDLCKRTLQEPSYRDLTLIVDGTSMSHVLDTPAADMFVEIAMKCHAVLCCRLSPIQKAKIVKLIKNSPDRPITAAIGDGANDISMIQEAHVGFGIFGKEGHQAARSADFAFTKFSMIKKVLLVLGHWYYQRLATLIHFFFYKNLVLGNIMFIFQTNSMFSTQSIFDSMYLTFYNLLFTSVPCLILAVTDQRWPANLLLKNPTLYRQIRKNKLLGWQYFVAWFFTALYHSLIIYYFSLIIFEPSVINMDGQNVDLWSFGAVLFHLMLLVATLKLWLQASYHTLIFVASSVLSFLVYMAFNTLYSWLYLPIDGDVLGTYIRLLKSPAFGFLNLLIIIATLVPDFCVRIISAKWGARHIIPENLISAVFTTRL